MAASTSDAANSELSCTEAPFDAFHIESALTCREAAGGCKSCFFSGDAPADAKARAIRRRNSSLTAAMNSCTSARYWRRMHSRNGEVQNSWLAAPPCVAALIDGRIDTWPKRKRKETVDSSSFGADAFLVEAPKASSINSRSSDSRLIGKSCRSVVVNCVLCRTPPLDYHDIQNQALGSRKKNEEGANLLALYPVSQRVLDIRKHCHLVGVMTVMQLTS
jgi:hypothetical protein